MRITFTARAAPPIRGGIQSYLRLVAAGLAAQEHHVTVLTKEVTPRPGIGNGRRLLDGAGFEPFDRWGYTTAPLGVTSRRRPLARLSATLELAAPRVPGLRTASRLPYVRALWPEIRDRAAPTELLHCMNGGDFSTATMHAARALGVPFVVTPHAHRGQWDDAESDARTYRQADAVVAVSESDAALYASLGVAPARLHLIRPCTAPPPPDTGSPADAAREPTLLFLGRRDAYKGLELLLEALPAVRAVLPSARLIVAGPGDMPTGFATDGVVDAGMVDDEEKVDLLRTADLLCLPSAYESFGLVVAEAWSVGTPVLTSETPALAELVQQGGGGVSVPRSAPEIAAAAIQALGDRDRLDQLGAAGAAYWGTELAPERTVARLSALYEDLLRDGGRSVRGAR